MPRKQKSCELLLDSLGVIGCGEIEPVIIASLAQRDPLLLIGPHGTGKSFLLTRLAGALRLEFRHYNASLLCFDDLVGYPLPDASGSLRYVQTPATIWGAQAVFFDEISRCRPEIQNKLFSIIHERRVQGLALERLAYRWSAMNPPAAGDSAADYAGSEPLDRALADRFSYISELPDWSGLSADDQERLILTPADDPAEESKTRLQLAVAAAERSISALRTALASVLGAYVRVTVGLLNQAAVGVSPRRAVMLFRNICGIHAARLQSTADPKLEDSAWLALSNSLCQRALGEPVPAMKVAAAHKEAWKASRAGAGTAYQAVLLEPRPLRRGLLALSLGGLSKADFSSIAADCLASLPPGARHAFALELFESAAAERLVAAVAEQCAELYEVVASPQNLHETLAANGTRHRVWQRVVQWLGRMEKGSADTAATENLLVGLFARGELATEADADRTIEEWQATRAEIRKLRG